LLALAATGQHLYRVALLYFESLKHACSD
jgi:hypothetical protein